MAPSISAFFLVSGCLTSSLFHNSSGGNIGKKENQRCGNEKFYCPMKKQCIDRKLRCTASTSCTSMKCYKASTPSPDTYEYFLKKSPLPLTSWLFSKRKRRGSELRHWFVEYRGFAYEFGSYGLQELDVNDPKYKYGPGREKVVFNENNDEPTGSSTCTRDQVLSFMDKWLQANPKYHLLKNNCQHFAKQLLKELGENCAIIEGLKAPSQCYTSSSFSCKLHALFAALILFAIFRNTN